MKRTLPFFFAILGLTSAVDGADAPLSEIRPILEKACFSCHGDTKQKSGLNLQQLAPPDNQGNGLKEWRHLNAVLINGDMPPSDAPVALTEAERERLITWISGLRYHGPADPGRVSLRRLNRTEYANTVRDLLAVTFDPTEDFPTDEVGNGFDNQADVLALPPLLFEKYVAAAYRLIDKAVPVKAVRGEMLAAGFSAMAADKPLPLTVTDGVVTLSESGEFRAPLYIPVSGKYSLRLRLAADNIGTEPVRAAVRIDGQTVKEIKVAAERRSPAYQLIGVIPLDRGEHQLGVIFLNPQHFEKGGKEKAPKTFDRALILSSAAWQGPPPPAPTPAQKQLLCAEPGPGVEPRAAAQAVLTAFLPRAWRRVVTAEEVERLLPLFDQALKCGDPYDVALKQPLQAALLSPHFLYRIEHGGPPTAGVARLTDPEIASRLSYFLWSTMPDAALTAAAAKGELATPAGRKAQVTRMLMDPRSRNLVDNFAEQWLLVRNLENFKPDPKQFPQFTPALRVAMAAEPLEFMNVVLREDRSVLEFLRADWTMANGVLAKHYGMTGVDGAQFRKVTLSDPVRGGVMTMAGVLAVTSNPDRTNPPKRGKFVLEQLLDDPPPPPPPAVAALAKAAGDLAGLSTRQLFERHRADVACASCHRRIDPIGFAFENFDVLGRVRLREGSAVIDTSGVMPDGTHLVGIADLKRLLVENQGKRTEFLRCLAGKMLTYAIGRGMQSFDEPAIDTLVDQLTAADHRFGALILGVVESYPFLNRRPAGTP